MYVFNVLLLIYFVIVASSLQLSDKYVAHGNGRIIGGSNVAIEKIPYQLSLQKSGKHFCGATIIGSSWAVSSAKCVKGAESTGVYRVASKLTVRSGSSKHSSGGKTHDVLKIATHSSYNSRIHDYDIAVLQVNPPFSLGSPGVNKIELATQGSSPRAGDLGIVSGWGVTTVGGSSLSGSLQQVSVPIISDAVCQTTYGKKAITDRMFCAGYASGGKDACNGDDGGPLVIKNKLVGIVSWGKECALAGFPKVYAKIGNLRSWIKEKTMI